MATDKAEVASVATPEPFSTPEPMFVAPSKKFTVPVGVPPPEVTVAVKVTEVPNVEGFSDEVSAVVELAALTTCDSTGACVYPAQYKTCGTLQSCVGETYLPPWECDGEGTCAMSPPVPCAPFVCNPLQPHLRGAF